MQQLYFTHHLKTKQSSLALCLSKHQIKWIKGISAAKGPKPTASRTCYNPTEIQQLVQGCLFIYGKNCKQQVYFQTAERLFSTSTCNHFCQHKPGTPSSHRTTAVISHSHVFERFSMLLHSPCISVYQLSLDILRLKDHSHNMPLLISFCHQKATTDTDAQVSLFLFHEAYFKALCWKSPLSHASLGCSGWKQAAEKVWKTTHICYTGYMIDLMKTEIIYVPIYVHGSTLDWTWSATVDFLLR